MAAADGREDTPLIETLRRSPQQFEFFQAVLLLEEYAARQAEGGRVAGTQPVGEAADPRSEALHFSGGTSLAFPASEVGDLKERPGAPPILVESVIGLYGHTGVLPQHYSETILARLRENDEGLRAFIDVLTHRTVSMYVRAWKKYRLAAQARGLSADEDAKTAKTAAGIVGLIDAIIGFGTGGLHGRLSPPHAIFRFYAGAYAGNPRSATVLEAVLSDYFGEPITVETFVPRWELLDPSEQTQLVPAGYCRLGEEALIGARIMRPEGAFRIRLGPLSYKRFRAFLPDGQWLGELVHMARLFVGEALYFDVRPALKRAEVPELQLGVRPDGDGPRTGWNTWLISAPPATDRDDTVLASRLIG